MNTRSLSVALRFAAMLGAAVSLPLAAQSFPNQPVKLVVPFPAGGGVDLVARIVAAPLSQQLGQPVEVVFVKGRFAADGQADTMNRQGIVGADTAQVMMERASWHHVILGVNFKEAEIRAGFEDRLEMFRLQAQSAAGRQGASRCRSACRGCLQRLG